jgi:hypothetical protein
MQVLENPQDGIRDPVDLREKTLRNDGYSHVTNLPVVDVRTESSVRRVEERVASRR